MLASCVGPSGRRARVRDRWEAVNIARVFSFFPRCHSLFTAQSRARAPAAARCRSPPGGVPPVPRAGVRAVAATNGGSKWERLRPANSGPPPPPPVTCFVGLPPPARPPPTFTSFFFSTSVTSSLQSGGAVSLSLCASLSLSLTSRTHASFSSSGSHRLAPIPTPSTAAISPRLAPVGNSRPLTYSPIIFRPTHPNTAATALSR